MSTAWQLFGTAALFASAGFVLWVVGRIWLRAREQDRERDRAMRPAPLASSEALELLRHLDARLANLEHSVETAAVEVERVAEAQRFLTRRLNASNDLQ